MPWVTLPANDPRIRYTGHWEDRVNGDRTFRATRKVGSNVYFEFQGTHVRVIGTLPSPCTPGNTAMMSWRVNGGPLVAGIQTCDPIKPNEPFTYVSWETEPHGTHNVNMTYGIYGLDPNYAEEFWLERIEYDALEGEVIPPRPQPTISTPAPEPPRVTSSKPREITKTPEVVPPPSPTSSPSTTSVRTFADFVESDRNGATTMVMSTVPSMTRITSSLSTVPSTSPPIESGDADIDPLDGESDVSAGMASGPAAFANALVGGLVLLAMVDMLFLFARRKARRD